MLSVNPKAMSTKPAMTKGVLSFAHNGRVYTFCKATRLVQHLPVRLMALTILVKGQKKVEAPEAYMSALTHWYNANMMQWQCLGLKRSKWRRKSRWWWRWRDWKKMVKNFTGGHCFAATAVQMKLVWISDQMEEKDGYCDGAMNVLHIQ